MTLQEARTQIFIKKALKARKRTPDGSTHVTLKVTGEKERRLAHALGWELVAPLSQGRGAGFHQYLMQKPYFEVDLDTAA